MSYNETTSAIVTTPTTSSPTSLFELPTKATDIYYVCTGIILFVCAVLASLGECHLTNIHKLQPIIYQIIK